MTENRLWSADSMEWAMAPSDCRPGDRFIWAGKSFIVVQKDGLRIRRLREKAPEAEPENN